MIRQIKLLTKIQICNLFGINEFRFNKDPKKKRRFIGLAFVWILLIIMMIGYLVAASYGLCFMGMGSIVPKMLSMVVGIVVLFFTFFKAGSVIFGQKAFEMQMSLPVTKTAVVISRFLTMYVTDLLLSLLMMITGMTVYGYMEKPNILFYVYGIIGTCFLPLLPITIGTILGAGITALSARWKYKNMASAILTLSFATVIVILNMSFSGKQDTDLLLVLKNLSGLIEQKIHNIYPPAIWLGNAMIKGTISSLLFLIITSILLFALVIGVIQKYFLSICTSLNAAHTNGRYEMKELTTNSVLKSLWKKELRHYFSCSIYMANTMMAYLLMVIIAVVALVMGVEKAEQAMGINRGFVKLLPIILGVLPAISPMTSSSISLEGKQWWIVQSLPIKMKDILTSKILANLTVVFPFYVIAEIVIFIAVKPSGLDILWITAIPMAFIIFAVLAGLFINLKFPVFNWESEAHVVKQGASTFISIITAIISAVVPIEILIAFPNVSADLILGIVFLVFAAMSAFLKIRINTFQLK